MASLESPNSPSRLSFAIREETSREFLRNISTREEPSSYSYAELPYSTHNSPIFSFPTTSSSTCCTTPNNTYNNLVTNTIESSSSYSYTEFPCSTHNSPIFSFPTSSTSCTTPSNTYNNLVTNTIESSSRTYSYRCLSSVLKKDGQILSIAISNGLIYTGSATNVIRLWKLPEFTECGQLKTKASTVVALEVSHDRVYAAYGDGKIRVWRRTWDGGFKHVRLATIPSTGSYCQSYIGRKDKMMKHLGPITSLAINISYDILYTASVDKTVKVWRISDFKCIETIKAHPQPINAVAVAGDGTLYTASDDATVKVWRRNFYSIDQPHSLTITLPAKFSPVKTLTLTSDNGVLYGGCSDGYVHYWLKDWFSGQLQYGGALQGHTHAIMCIANVGNYVISGSADSTVRVWARESDYQHTSLAVLVGHRGPVKCVTAFLGRLLADDNEDGCTICTGSLDGVLKMWYVMRTHKEGGYLLPNSYEYFELQ